MSDWWSHPDHVLLDSAPNLGPLISRWEINEVENWWYKSVRILEVLKVMFQQLLNLSGSQRDMSGPILGDLSKNRWSGGIHAAGNSWIALYYTSSPISREDENRTFTLTCHMTLLLSLHFTTFNFLSLLLNQVDSQFTIWKSHLTRFVQR